MFKILVIDDSAFSRNSIKKILGGDFQYVEASSGEQGLELYPQENPHLVILDLTMPGIGGLETLARMRRMWPESRVIIGSADIQTFNRNLTLELGALAFLNKPFDKEVFRGTVEKALQGLENG